MQQVNYNNLTKSISMNIALDVRNDDSDLLTLFFFFQLVTIWVSVSILDTRCCCYANNFSLWTTTVYQFSHAIEVGLTYV